MRRLVGARVAVPHQVIAAEQDHAKHRALHLRYDVWRDRDGHEWARVGPDTMLYIRTCVRPFYPLDLPSNLSFDSDTLVELVGQGRAYHSADVELSYGPLRSTMLVIEEAP